MATQVKDPLWSFLERLERDLKAAREYAELLERERDEARRSIDRRNADLVDMNARLDSLGYDDIKRRIAAMVEGA